MPTSLPPGSLKDLVESSSHPLIAIRPNGSIVYWNWGAEITFGFAREEALGKEIHSLLTPPDEHARLKSLLEEAVLTGSALFETPCRKKDGSVIYAETVWKASGPTGKPDLIAISCRDVTDQQRLAEQLLEKTNQLEKTVKDLEVAKEAAESAARAKSAFLANMSHEIRTPMNAVIGMASLLLDSPLSEEQREFTETIRTSGDHLLSVISDVLDYSKIESGKLELELIPFELRTCIEEALDLVAPKAAEKNLDLAYLLGEEVPHAVMGDVGRLRQILVNLLSNAVKFTEHGEVVVSVNSQRVPANEHELQFDVRDTGIGIRPDQLERLFRAFTQADSGATRRFGGTGLGLAISKRLVEQMGGRIWAESQEGVGSTFHFTIKASLAGLPLRVTVRGTEAALKGKRVLIVDDNPTNRLILTLQTQKWGMRPKDSPTPNQALEWLKNGEAFDVAVVDYQMPGMDGIRLAKEIGQTAAGKGLPMILLSSMGSGRDAARHTDVEFSAFLTKPVKQTQLHEALGQALAVRLQPPTVAGAVAKRPASSTARILVVEDNPVNQKVALLMLQRLGHDADLAADGKEAIDAISRTRYDLVFLDVQMPVMDGIECAKAICERWPKTARPRLVAMTAYASNEDRDRCLAAGMDDYLSKPVTLEALSASLARGLPGNKRAS